MKKLNKFVLAVFILITINSIAFGQSGWSPLNINSQENFNSAHFVTDDVGYVVGFQGIIKKTTNAGLNWETINISNSSNLRSVHFTTENTGYVVAENYSNKLIKTTDEGISWFELTTPVYCNYYYVTFINMSTGFISGSGGHILKTTNAGVNWFEAFTPDPYMNIYNLHFTSMLTGYAADIGGNILRTTDGGIHWNIVYAHPSDGYGIYSISFKNASIGIAVGGKSNDPQNSQPLILRTIDGGTTWYGNNFDNGSSCVLRDVKFVSPDNAFIVGKNYNPNISSVILKTTNSGISWYQQQVPSSNLLSGVFFTDLYTGYAMGDSGTILKTTNGGESLTGMGNVNNEITDKFKLSQNYPNPFNPSTKITFSIPNSENVKLKIYDETGKQIKLLINEFLNTGNHEVEFNADDYSSGVYFYKLETEGYSETKKMLLMK